MMARAWLFSCSCRADDTGGVVLTGEGPGEGEGVDVGDVGF
jgi:hypothetical protein